MIVLHGGGWCVGHARHDERFIETVTQRGRAVVVAVNYRLAPEHAYPVPLLDCVDAMLYIWKNATAMGVDKHRTFITGFSVGGQMAFASQYWLAQAIAQHEHPQIDRASLGTVKAITAFYPPMDLTKTRAQRAASNPASMALKKKPASSSKLIGDIFDRAYFWNLPDTIDKSQICISPGLAPLEMMSRALPNHIYVKLAGLDPLLAEGKAAAAQFEAAGKHVECEVVENVPHYWDHLGKTEHEKTLRSRVYERAADEMEEVLRNVNKL